METTEITKRIKELTSTSNKLRNKMYKIQSEIAEIQQNCKHNYKLVRTGAYTREYVCDICQHQLTK
jgi:hypothetical protein